MFNKYFLLFIIYSFLGWLMEILWGFIREHNINNRGFLLGPYCPIYGCGCILLTIFLSKYQNDVFALFSLSMIICAVLEYSTSYLLEKIFKLRWWDYTNKKYNINGRICLEYMIPFAIAGTISIKYINPFIIDLINITNYKLLTLIVVILASLFVIDVIISCNIIFNIKQVTKNIKKDSTQEIKEAVHDAIHNNMFMYDRIIKAFPTVYKILKEKKDKRK